MNVKNKGISYVRDENAWSRYTYFLEGRRVFDVLVDNATPVTDLPDGVGTPPPGHSAHVIRIARVDAPISTAQATKGLAVRVPLVTDAGMGYQVDGNSIRTYIHGREAHFLARLFVAPA